MHCLRTRICTLALVLLTALMVGACQERGVEPQQNVALRSLVEGATLEAAITGPEMTSAERTKLADQVRRFYRGQKYQLIWIDGERPSRLYRDLVGILGAAEDHGLPSALYSDPLGEASGEDMEISAEQVPALDVKATAALFRYSLHLSSGRLDPHALQSLWTLRPRKPDLVNALTRAVTESDLAKVVGELEPAQPEYQELRKALIRYRAIAAKGGWPTLHANTKLKPGQQSAVMPALRQRLAMEGDLDPAHEKTPGTTYDSNVVSAVKRFEQRHRLEPDGIIDAEAVKALNVPIDRRIRMIELSMERWRWLPDEMPSRYLMVNVPDFHLEAVENQQTVMDIRVVVGAPDNKTPIFADEMTHVVFSPYWNVPPGIAEEETIPRATGDPDFISRNNMEVVGPKGDVIDPSSVDWSNAQGLRIRQRPGSGNALGGVKFIFPNTFDVYLHDTNATKLFDRLERGLSHGCVRVEEPHKLAQYVLRDLPEWTPEAIAQAMKSDEEKHVKLKTPIPVYITYQTAVVHDGGVRFLEDLYGYDADQSTRLWRGRDTTTGHKDDGTLLPRR